MADESIFREVDEEVRRQQLENLWKRWGNVIIAASIVVFAIVAGVKFWQYQQVKRAEAGATSYFAALKLAADGKKSEADKLMQDLAAGPHAGFALLAKLQEAGLLADEGKTEEAVKAYDEIAASNAIDQNTRNAVRIRAAMLLVDTASPADIAKRVGDLNTPDSIWRNQVREMLGLVAYRTKDYLTADKFMNEIVGDPDAPPNLRQRAQLMISLLAPRLDQPQPAVQ